MIEVYGATFSQWSNAAVWMEKDKGSIFVNLWAEHTSVQSAVPTQAILLGNTTTTAHNTKFLGTTSITLLDETYAVRHIKSLGASFEQLNLSTNGSLPTSAIVRQDAAHSGRDVYQRMTFMTGVIPGSWDYGLLLSKDPSATGKIIVKSLPGKAGSATNTTVGDDGTLTGDYRIEVSGSPGAATYWAKDADGHVAALYWDTTTTSGLKAVLGKVAASNTHVHFGRGRFHFLDAPLGTESFANTETGCGFSYLTGLTLSGESMTETIVSNRSNTITASPDLAIFLFTNCNQVTIRDMTVEFCGSYMSTMEAINCNQGNGFHVSRVKFLRSKSTAFTFDGGDIGKSARGNVLRDCLFYGRPSLPQIDLNSTAGTLSNGTTYTYAVAYRDLDLAYFTGVTATTGGGSTATLTTSAAHKFTVGETVTIQNMSVSAYNGRFTITAVPSSTTFSYALGSNAADASAGVVIGPGTTKLSDPSFSVTPSNNTSSVKVYLPIGPYTTAQRLVYRSDGTTWKLVQTINDNTTLNWTDTGVAGSAVTMPVSNKSNVPHSGIQLLANSGTMVSNNYVDGCGDVEISGTSSQGIRLAKN